MNNQNRLILDKEQLNSLVNSCQEEIRRLKEEYIMLQNASEEYEDKLLKENQRLNNVLNELEKWLKETDRTIDFNYVVVRVKDILEKIHELKESDK